MRVCMYFEYTRYTTASIDTILYAVWLPVWRYGLYCMAGGMVWLYGWRFEIDNH